MNEATNTISSARPTKSLPKMGKVMLAALCAFIALPAAANLNLPNKKEARQAANLKYMVKAGYTRPALNTDAPTQNGKHLGFKQEFKKIVGLDVALDTRLHTNRRNNSVEWIVDVVTDLFSVNYKTDQTRTRDRLDLSSSYALNKQLRVKGQITNQNQGNREFHDYSVGVAYSVNPSMQITAGYADRELKKVDTQGNVFVNINGVF